MAALTRFITNPEGKIIPLKEAAKIAPVSYPALLGRLKVHGDNWTKVVLDPPKNRSVSAWKDPNYVKPDMLPKKRNGKKSKKRTPAILAPALEKRRDPYEDYSIGAEMAARAEAELAAIKERGYREWLHGDQQSSI